MKLAEGKKGRPYAKLCISIVVDINPVALDPAGSGPFGSSLQRHGRVRGHLRGLVQWGVAEEPRSGPWPESAGNTARASRVERAVITRSLARGKKGDRLFFSLM